jgi:hypothetical protein
MASLRLIVTALFLRAALSFELKSVPSYNNPPQRRQLTSMCYDSISNSLLLYGGFKDAGHFFNEMWIYSIQSKTWRIIVPASYTAPCKI